MKNILVYTVFCFLLLPIFSNAQISIESNITKVILVRHAEKEADGSQDPPLSEDGLKRAERLDYFSNDVKVDKIYSTPYKRTMQTLSFVAKSQKLIIENYNPSDKSFTENLLAKHKGKTVLIAGHSNTIPALANYLVKSEKYEQLSEAEYGKIWVLIFNNDELIDCSVYNY